MGYDSLGVGIFLNRFLSVLFEITEYVKTKTVMADIILRGLEWMIRFSFILSDQGIQFNVY
jgi:hypothetical protein